MPPEVKLWKIENDELQPVAQSRLDLEGRLEEWLCGDIRLLSDDLLVIGRQIERYGLPLDVLAVDRDGNLVVVELKRDRTPRDVVAQALDYASWVQELGREDVERYTTEHLGKPFDEAFRRWFGDEPPEVVNERHRIYIVASSLDGTTQRIVEYLSSTHGVDINAAAFAYFNTGDGEFVARSLLLDEEDVERRAKAAAWGKAAAGAERSRTARHRREERCCGPVGCGCNWVRNRREEAEEPDHPVVSGQAGGGLQGHHFGVPRGKLGREGARGGAGHGAPRAGTWHLQGQDHEDLRRQHGSGLRYVALSGRVLPSRQGAA